MAEDWDLYAVVRSCTSAANTSRTTESDNFRNENSGGWGEDPLACLASLTFQEEDDAFPFSNLSQLRKSGSLQDSYKPFLPNADPTTISSTNQGIDPCSNLSSVPGGSSGRLHQHQMLQQQQQQQPTTTTSIGISSPLTPTSAPIFDFGRFGNKQHPHHVQEQPQSQQQIDRLHVQVQQQRDQPEVQRPAAVLPSRNVQPQVQRSRKRKNQQKRTVCHVTAENLSSDPWAWRKYGQKPIKGSPYPRNYYRCSSSKGCSARKQVERSNLDPDIFIVSYTGDHTHPKPTHRNSLAGSTRNKLSTTQKAASKDSTPETLLGTAASCSSPRSATSFSPISPTTPLSAPEDATAAPVHNTGENGSGEEESVDMTLETTMDGESDEDNDLLIPNVHVDEDLFKGLEELVGSAGVGTSSSGMGRNPAFGDNFSSWGTGNSTAAGAPAGGGC